MKKILSNLSLFAILISMGFYVGQLMWDAKWNLESDVIKIDVIGYYSYLPATFIFNDLSLDFVDKYEGEKKFLIWYDELPNGNRFIRYSVGQAVLYSPFFFMGHAYASLFDFNTGGYSAPYKFFLVISCLFYLTIGLLALRKLLLRYFPDYAVGLTIIALCFATNLNHYVIQETAMTHAYSFSLISIFLLCVDNWYRKQTIKGVIYLGLIFGLFTLVRPFNSLVGIVFIFYGLKSFKEVIPRLRLLLQKYYMILIIALIALIIWIPQFLYWKFVSGSYLFYSYDLSGGKFFFDNPHVIDGLFSYRKGWFLYNPIMLFIIPGIFLIRRYFKGFQLAFLVFIPVFIYCLFSWWSWWYGGGFSIRSMIDIYAIYALPMAASMAYFFQFKKPVLKYSFLAAFSFLLITGFIFNRQYKKGIIHYDGMTKEAFWYAFYNFKVQPDYWDLICRPDYELARQGIYECTHNLGKYRDAETQPRRKN